MSMLPPIGRLIVLCRAASACLLLALGTLPPSALAQFASINDFVSQQYRDIGGREPEVGAFGYWAPQGQTPPLVRGLLEEVDGSQGAIVRLYFSYFDRIPDYAGFSWQSEQFLAGNYASLAFVSAAFYASPEFQSYQYGSLDNAQFVTLLYNRILKRPPDQGGLDFHVQVLNSGFSRPDLILSFTESAENKALRYSDTRLVLVTARMLHSVPASLPQGIDLNTHIASILASSEYSTRIAGAQASLALQDCNNTFPTLGPVDCVVSNMPSRVVDRASQQMTLFNQMAFEVTGVNPAMIVGPVTYDPGTWTGLSVPSAVRSSFQLGRYDTGYDSSGNAIVTPVVQLHNAHGGAVINTWWFDFPASQASTFGALDFNYGIVWQFPDSALAPDSNLRPLISQFQPGRLTNPSGFPGIRPFDTYDSQLMIQANVKVPTSIRFLSSSVTQGERNSTGTPNGPSAQLYFVLVFLDQSRGDLFFCVVGLYDNDGPRPNQVLPDDGIGRPFCSFSLPLDGATPSHPFLNLSPFSRGSSITTWSEDRFFRFHITRTNMIRIINAINAVRDPAKQLSGDPGDYLLIDALLQAEIVYAKNAGASPQDTSARDNITLGYSFGGFGVWKLR